MPRHGPPRGGGHGGPAGGVQPRHQARVRHPLHRGRHHGRGRELRVEGPGRTGGQVRDQLVWFEWHPGDIPARLDQIAFVQIVSVPPPPGLPTSAHPTTGAALCRHQPRHQLGLGTLGCRSTVDMLLSQSNLILDLFLCSRISVWVRHIWSQVSPSCELKVSYANNYEQQIFSQIFAIFLQQFIFPELLWMLSWRAPRINLSPGQTNQLKILSENLSIESGQNKIDR